MTAGRKATPTALKLIQGNPGKRAINKNEPKPSSVNVKMPVGLSPTAKKQWTAVAKNLKASGVLTVMDAQALQLYCESYALWKDAMEKIQKYGAIVKTPNGFPTQSPYLQIANKQSDFMVKMLIEFGMTPSSRSKVSIDEKTDPSDPLAKYGL
jgi:P27 family predicted phage terminase small subunit